MPLCPSSDAPTSTPRSVFRSKSTCQGPRARGTEPIACTFPGREAGLTSQTRTATAPSPGAATFPAPLPPPADATHTGLRPRPLTQWRVSRIHSQTECRHLNWSAGLPVCAPARPPETQPTGPKREAATWYAPA